MSNDDKKNVEQQPAGAGALQGSYEKRHAAYKEELNRTLAKMPIGGNVGPLIASLRKKYELDSEAGGQDSADNERPQGNWGLAELRKQQEKRAAKEAGDKAAREKQADEKKRLKDLKTRLYRARFQMPRGFSWPEEARNILQPFEFAQDREIWACFSFLKVLLRESLAQEFNLSGIEVDLIKFTDEANNYPGGEKQLLTDSLSALKSLLRIMLSKPQAEKSAPKAEKPVVGDQRAPVAPVERRQRAQLQPASPRQAEPPVELPFKPEPKSGISVILPQKSEFSGFQWTNKFRKTFNLKPMPSNEELEKGFCLLTSQYQRAVVFRFRIARPAVSLKQLMVGGMKRGVEELVKRAMEEFRQKVFAVRQKQGVSIKPFVPVEEVKIETKPLPAPAAEAEVSMVGFLPAFVEITREESFLKQKPVPGKTAVFIPRNELLSLMFPSVPATKEGQQHKEDFSVQRTDWIEKVRTADSAAIQNLFGEISLKKLNKALLMRGVSAESIERILPLAKIVKKGTTFTLKQAKVFLLCFGESKVPFKTIGETFGIGSKTARVISGKAINKIAVFLKDYGSVVQGEFSHSHWLEKVAALDLRDLKAIEEFLHEAPFSKIQAALGAAEPCQDTIKAIALVLRQPGVFGVSLNERSAKVFLITIAEQKIPAAEIADKLFGGNVKVVDNGRYKGLAKLASIWREAAKAGASLLAYIESLLAQKKVKPARDVAAENRQLSRQKALLAEALEMAQDVWTDRLLISLRTYLGELANLLVHPDQLALALNFHSKGIAKDVFLLFFGRSSAKTITEITECLGRTQKEVTQKEVIDAKTKLLRRISRRLRRILPESQPETVFSVYLTPGFSPAKYAALREKEAIGRKQPKDEKVISQKLRQWLAGFGEQRIKRLALAVAAQLKERGLEDWLLAELGLEPVEEVKMIPSPASAAPLLPEAPDSLSEPSAGKQLRDEPVIKRGDCSHAARLLKNPAFRSELGICILPEALRRILPELEKIAYFQKNGLKPFKILEMRYLGKGNGGKPLSKLKIGEKLGGYTRPTVTDWLKRIMERIRSLALGDK